MLGCSVIVCTRYREAPLGRCLESLAGLDHPSYEVVVVDNSPGDPAARRLASDSGARYVREPRTGVSRARNTGAAAASGELVAFIDDDAAAEPSWLAAHSAALADTSLAAATGRVIPISPQAGAGQNATRMLDLGETPFRVDRGTPSWFEIANFGGLGFGANMAFRRELFDRGLRFRDSLGFGARLGWGEELYAFFSIIREDHAIAYVPEAVIRHDPGPADRSSMLRRRSAAYLCMLWIEEKPFRRTTARYGLDSLRRRRQPWRRSGPEVPTTSRASLLAASVGGPILYLRSRFDRR